MQTKHVVLKGTREGLVLYLDPHLEFNILLDEIENNLTKANQFLQGAAVHCYWVEKECSEKQSESLIGILERHGLEFSGWLTAADLPVPEKKIPESTMPEAKRFWEEGIAEAKCLFVEKTLRSGKSINFNGHVLVIGDVNPGAEIIATGNIIVLGVLRGVAHAGVAGERNAVVTAYHLNPTQLRIADHVTRAPDEEVAWRGPEIARISNGKIIVESLV
ncbi:MAG: septum site-determining protein MinC [Desulfitobacteriaceae bacterium]|nr:septum site-determining protein MinC [Desulfitobacteriaceae bacterium]MDD4345736.1 septum site-determining protein MinC [Desulfitobacteriaceae bacterium]MDD4400406.1 septum site-determining protein MinC [Desulfitobacteriaceae bacterium]